MKKTTSTRVTDNRQEWKRAREGMVESAGRTQNSFHELCKAFAVLSRAYSKKYSKILRRLK